MDGGDGALLTGNFGQLLAGPRSPSAPPSATADREVVEAWRPSSWVPDVWSFIVEDAAARLRRSEGFRLDHHSIADALEVAGELTFDECAALVG